MRTPPPLRQVLLAALCLLVASCDTMAPDEPVSHAALPTTSAPARPALLHVERGTAPSGKAGVYAAAVTSALQGQAVPSGAIAPERRDPAAALGAPDRAFYSLGFDRLDTDATEGELVLDFGSGQILRGLTITVYEETYGGRYPRESADVYVGENPNGPWHLVGRASNDGSVEDTRASTFDISDVCVQFVRLVDRTDRKPFKGSRRGDGFDVNALQAESAGTCGAAFSIAGTVFEDENENGSQDEGESGLQDVVVKLEKGATVAYATTTPEGLFTFSVPAGTYTLTIPPVAEGRFNAQLYATHTYTGPGGGQRTVTVGPSTSDADFGFALDVAGVTKALLDGDIPTQGKDTKYWTRVLRHACLGSQTPGEVSAETLDGYLAQIEELLLPRPFEFTISENACSLNRACTALAVLADPSDDEVADFFRELLTAELNVVSGNGSESEAFDRALLAYAESVGYRLLPPGAVSGKAAAGATVKEVTRLLAAFNGGGGGVGGPR